MVNNAGSPGDIKITLNNKGGKFNTDLYEFSYLQIANNSNSPIYIKYNSGANPSSYLCPSKNTKLDLRKNPVISDFAFQPPNPVNDCK